VPVPVVGADPVGALEVEELENVEQDGAAERGRSQPQALTGPTVEFHRVSLWAASSSKGSRPWYE
jgi:hypothetical protein